MTVTPTTEQLRLVVQGARLAPSVHNTQPWRFLARPGGFELHGDPSRRLAVLDPDGRQLHLSCGAALLHARITARALGLQVTVRLRPDPTDEDHLADLTLVNGAPPDEQEIRLAAAMVHRRTHRGGFEDRPVPAALIDLLRHDVENEGALLHEVVRRDDVLELAVLLSRADDDEQRDAGYREELHRWVKDEGAPDGVPVAATGLVHGSTLRQRDFTLADPASLDGTSPPAEHPAIVVLATSADDPDSWLRAGQALAVALLRAADHGVQAQPLGQVTDLPAYRVRLGTRLGLVSIPQLVLRMGFPDSPPARIGTPRRAVEQMFATVAG